MLKLAPHLRNTRLSTFQSVVSRLSSTSSTPKSESGNYRHAAIQKAKSFGDFLLQTINVILKGERNCLTDDYSVLNVVVGAALNTFEEYPRELKPFAAIELNGTKSYRLPTILDNKLAVNIKLYSDKEANKFDTHMRCDQANDFINITILFKSSKIKSERKVSVKIDSPF